MNELLSVVATVKPVEAGTAPGHLGRAVHALLLRWLDEQAPDLARHWHDAEGAKPFTCTTLVGPQRNGANTIGLEPDRSYWFRITTFDTSVSSALREILAAPPETVELDGITLQLEALTTDPKVHPWAGETSFEALSSPYLLARQGGPRRLRMQFASPTTFRQKGMNVTLPLPGLVFGSLANRWNAFSPVAISAEVRTYAEECVAVNNFKLQSNSIAIKDGGLQIGAVGKASFVAVHYDRYWMSLLGLLADFAFYAGVGRMTTTGLGQTRRIIR